MMRHLREDCPSRTNRREAFLPLHLFLLVVAAKRGAICQRSVSAGRTDLRIPSPTGHQREGGRREGGRQRREGGRQRRGGRACPPTSRSRSTNPESQQLLKIQQLSSSRRYRGHGGLRDGHQQAGFASVRRVAADLDWVSMALRFYAPVAAFCKCSIARIATTLSLYSTGCGWFLRRSYFQVCGVWQLRNCWLQEECQPCPSSLPIW